jgi:hypothetical protein
MPTNLPPDYFAAEKRYRETKTPAEKVPCLEEMLAIMPKHYDASGKHSDSTGGHPAVLTGKWCTGTTSSKMGIWLNCIFNIMYVNEVQSG